MTALSRKVTGWPAGLAQSVGEEVRRLRKERGWTGADLSERLGQIGLKFEPHAITNLEANRRKTVAVHELVALAAVLGVPPLTLIVPELGADVELLPNQSTDGVRTIMWMTGRWLPYAAVVDDDFDAAQRRYDKAARPLDLIHEHESFVKDLVAAAMMRSHPEGGQLYIRALRALISLRGEFTTYDCEPPPLPPELVELGIEDAESVSDVHGATPATSSDTATPEETQS